MIPAIAKPSGIPKIIHQTCGNKKLPNQITENISKLKSLNPTWEYRYYPDIEVDQYVQAHFPEHFPGFKRLNPLYGAARADLFRYLLMYREGGVYLDIKSTFSKPLDETLQPSDSYLLSHWNNGPGATFERWGIYKEIANPRGEFQQCFIICAAGHPFLAAVIDRVMANIAIYDEQKHGVGKRMLHLTGPVAYSLAITPLLENHDHRMLDSESELGFVYNLYKLATGRKHHELYDNHYSKLTDPIVID